jgi:hypothetical protein
MTKVTDNANSFRFFLHRNMILVTSDGVIVTGPINPVAAQQRRSQANVRQSGLNSTTGCTSTSIASFLNSASAGNLQFH